MKKPINYWDTFTDTYQMGSQKHRVFLLDLLSRKGVESMLDVGCGTGPLYQMIRDTEDEVEGMTRMKRWEFEYKGTDYSQGMIEVCNREFPEGDFEQQDARELKEEDNSWDAVVLMHALDHLDDYQSAIKEASRVAKKYVCIILWRGFVAEGTNLNDRNMYGKEEGEDPWKDTHLQEYSREVLLKEFEKNNLVIEQEETGERISDEGKYNWLVLLRKND